MNFAEFCTKGNLILRRKEGLMNFRIKKSWCYGFLAAKKKSFPTQEVSRKVIFP